MSLVFGIIKDVRLDFVFAIMEYPILFEIIKGAKLVISSLLEHIIEKTLDYKWTYMRVSSFLYVCRFYFWIQYYYGVARPDRFDF